MRQRLEALERQSRIMPKLPMVDALLKDVFAFQHLMVNAIESLSAAGLALNENLLQLKIEVERLQGIADKAIPAINEANLWGAGARSEVEKLRPRIDAIEKRVDAVASFGHIHK